MIDMSQCTSFNPCNLNPSARRASSGAAGVMGMAQTEIRKAMKATRANLSMLGIRCKRSYGGFTSTSVERDSACRKEWSALKCRTLTTS